MKKKGAYKIEFAANLPLIKSKIKDGNIVLSMLHEELLKDGKITMSYHMFCIYCSSYGVLDDFKPRKKTSKANTNTQERSLEAINPKTNKFSIRLSDDELEIIRQKANEYNLKPCAYLRALGLGHKIKSLNDIKIYLELAKLRNNFNRVGGLFKMYLSSEHKYNNEQVSYILQEIIESKNNIDNYLLEFQAAINAKK